MQKSLNTLHSVVKKNAQILKSLRKTRGYTLENLSKLSGLSPSYISRLEASDRRLNTEIMQKLANALGCDPADFLKDDISDINFKNENGYSKNLPIYRIISSKNIINGSNASEVFKIFFDEALDFTFRLPNVVASQLAYAIYVVNDSLYPKFYKGDMLFIDPERALEVNKTVVLVNKNNEIFIGELKNFNNDFVEVASYLNLNDIKKFDRSTLDSVALVVSVVS